jgi:hypothetical protein
MPVNAFNVGRDVTLQLIGFDGTIANFALYTSFDAKQDTHQVKIMGMDGIVRFLELPAGWSGSMAFDRQDRSIDNYFANMESSYYSGLNVQAATITETITEVDGSTSQRLRVQVGRCWHMEGRRQGRHEAELVGVAPAQGPVILTAQKAAHEQ